MKTPAKHDRRIAPRLIKRVPVQIMPSKEVATEPQSAETLNISKNGAYFATDLQLREGAKLELRFKVPEEIQSLPPLECRFISRVAHVERLGANGKSGVGVHFLYYSLD